MIYLLEDYIAYIDGLYMHGHIKHVVHEDVMNDIGTYKYEEYDVDVDNKSEDYLATINIIFTLEDYEKWTDNKSSQGLMIVYKQSELEDSESNKGIDYEKDHECNS